MAEILLRAKTGFLLPDRTVVKGGQIVSATDRVVKGREHLFEPAETGVEQATKAPGELRVVSRARSGVVAKAVAKKATG